MKGINVNGTIKTYSSVPKTWGNILGFNYMSNEDLKEIGFYDVVKPTITASQELGDIYFDADNEVFTYPVQNQTWSETVAELKEAKINEVKSHYNGLLSKTDWIIIRDQELGNTTDQAVLDDRAQLRTDCATHETAINALTTKASIINYSYQ